MGKSTERKDVIATLEEWHDHPYTPGYYVGGRLPPYLLGKHPNKFGCALLVNGALLAGIFLFSVIAGITHFQGLSYESQPLPVALASTIFVVGLIVIQVVAGIRLLRKPSKTNERRKPQIKP
jgi:hypothetical protein